MGKLYIVPTPIGNLDDITLRALKILKNVDVILAEDTRKSSILLNHYEIKKPLRSYHKFNEHKSVKKIVDDLLGSTSMALITDSGTPAISDPGYLIVKECIEAGVEIECLPGPVAFVPALVLSGLPNDSFVFIGFLPQKKGRNKKIFELVEESRTMIFYESPFRVLNTLKQFSESFGGNRNVSVSRELTKKFEETIRGTLSELVMLFEQKPMKGEFVIVLEGKR